MDEIPIQEFTNSAIIFDDIDCLTDKRIREGVYNLLNQVLQIGRHMNVTALVTSHLSTDRNRTRIILCEAHIVVYFPRSSNNKIKYFLSEYVGLDKKQISEFKKLNSRWVAILKNYPGIFVSEHKLGLLQLED